MPSATEALTAYGKLAEHARLRRNRGETGLFDMGERNRALDNKRQLEALIGRDTKAAREQEDEIRAIARAGQTKA